MTKMGALEQLTKLCMIAYVGWASLISMFTEHNDTLKFDDLL